MLKDVKGVVYPISTPCMLQNYYYLCFVNSIIIQADKAVSLLALPSKQLQLFLIMVNVANKFGEVSEFTLFSVTNAVGLKASKVSGNLTALQKRRLIIEGEPRQWLVNPEYVRLTGYKGEMYKRYSEIEKKKAIELLNKVIGNEQSSK